MTWEKRFKLNKKWTVSVYHFYDNWKLNDRFTLFSIDLFGFGWENFGRKKILKGSKTYNIYIKILGFNFTFMKSEPTFSRFYRWRRIYKCKHL